MTLEGEPISSKALAFYLGECATYQNSTRPISFFEALTAAAFLSFRDHPADIIVMEVGLGGRLDATNISVTTCATVITPISLDHQNALGDSCAAIAGEKSGIMRSGIPCIASRQPSDALEVLTKRALALPCTLLAWGQDWFSQEKGQGMEVTLWDGTTHSYPSLGLVGDHQRLNAATAVATLHAQNAVSVPEHAIEQGLAQTQWPGRLQRLDTGRVVDTFPKESEIWVDGAHNAAGASILHHHITTYWKSKDELPFILVLGILSRKDCRPFFDMLAPLAHQIWCVCSFNQHDGTSLDEMKKQGFSPIAPCLEFSDLDGLLAHKPLTATPARILFCGSLYFVGEILARCPPSVLP